VDFAGAIGQLKQPPPESAVGALQVAFAGRSNVGKSSLINRLLGRTRTAIARVSAEPGKTQEINFYDVRSDLGSFFLVDLPGYGYAKVPQGLREKWRPLIHGFLANNPDLRGVVQLVDVRNGPSDEDVRSAWRRALSDAHPDRVIARGLPPEYLDVAHAKSAAINNAYEAIMKERRGLEAAVPA